MSENGWTEAGAKHAHEFFDIGQTVDDVRRLRYDIARRFDIDLAANRKIDAYVVGTFNIGMRLGVNKEKGFLPSDKLTNQEICPALLQHSGWMKMIQEYDQVKVKPDNILGQVVDIYTAIGETFYTVEVPATTPEGGKTFRLIRCEINDLQKA